MAIDSHKIHRWYRDVLSDFIEKGQNQLHENDIELVDLDSGEINTISVPICESQNIGKNMCIDEKQIGAEFYTIISNRETGKLVLMASTTKSSELIKAVSPIMEELSCVEIINRDLASCYRVFCNHVMPHAKQVGDKFHVIKLQLDAVQAVRISQKREIDTKKREAHKEFKDIEKQRKEACLKNSEVYKKRRFVYNEKKLSNMETPSEILRRSRYLLYKFPDQWTEKQQDRANVLFAEFPVLKQTYVLSNQFRSWYSKSNIGKHKIALEKELFSWYDNVEESGIVDLMNFSSTVERNEEYIINYFNTNGSTNAMAENRNGKIKKFINSNQGTRDQDFFFFRLKKYFT